MQAWSNTIAQPWGVTAFGQGDVHAEPDYAILRVAINRLHNEPRDALAAAKDGATSVRSSLRRLQIPEADVMSSRTSVKSSWNSFGSGRQFLGHQCRVEFAVRLTDLELVDEALIQLVDAGADEIQSVHYDTTQKPQLRAAARRAAVEAARRKAALYAEAAGAALGPVIHIDDVDPGNLAGDSHGMAMAVAMLSGSGDFAPGQLTVSAAVVLGFSLAQLNAEVLGQGVAPKSSAIGWSTRWWARDPVADVVGSEGRVLGTSVVLSTIPVVEAAATAVAALPVRSSYRCGPPTS